MTGRVDFTIERTVPCESSGRYLALFAARGEIRAANRYISQTVDYRCKTIMTVRVERLGADGKMGIMWESDVGDCRLTLHTNGVTLRQERKGWERDILHSPVIQVGGADGTDIRMTLEMTYQDDTRHFSQTVSNPDTDRRFFPAQEGRLRCGSAAEQTVGLWARLPQRAVVMVERFDIYHVRE